MSLLSSYRLLENPDVKRQVAAAIRMVAAERLGWAGAAGKLANACMLDPEIAVHHFAVRLAANPTVTKTACPSCGCVFMVEGSTVDDSIKYVVASEWGTIAEAIYPEPKPDTTEVSQ